jgi:hypothetical protein
MFAGAHQPASHTFVCITHTVLLCILYIKIVPHASSASGMSATEETQPRFSQLVSGLQLTLWPGLPEAEASSSIFLGQDCGQPVLFLCPLNIPLPYRTAFREVGTKRPTIGLSGSSLDWTKPRSATFRSLGGRGENRNVTKGGKKKKKTDRQMGLLTLAGQ